MVRLSATVCVLLAGATACAAYETRVQPEKLATSAELKQREVERLTTALRTRLILLNMARMHDIEYKRSIYAEPDSPDEFVDGWYSNERCAYMSSL